VADGKFDIASVDTMSFSVRSSSRCSSRMALRRRRSAVRSRASRVLRWSSMRSHFADARTAARMQAWIARLRSIEAYRWSSKNESGGMKLSFLNMVAPPGLAD
jgi:hypothetical protein